MEIEIAITVKALARVEIDADGVPRVIGIDIIECCIDDTEMAASP